METKEQNMVTEFMCRRMVTRPSGARTVTLDTVYGEENLAKWRERFGDAVISVAELSQVKRYMVRVPGLAPGLMFYKTVKGALRWAQKVKSYHKTGFVTDLLTGKPIEVPVDPARLS